MAFPKKNAEEMNPNEAEPDSDVDDFSIGKHAKKVSHKARSKRSSKFPQDLQNKDVNGKGAQTKQFKKFKLSMA